MDAPDPNGGKAWKTVERRSDARFDGSLRSTFTTNQGGTVRAVPCSIASLSSVAMRIETDEIVTLGQSIWVDVEGFGPVRASIETVRHDGFICQNMLNEPARKRLAVWIAWLARRNGRIDRDKRAFIRTRPHDSRTTVAFEDGEVIAVLLKDISRSGAAVVSEHTALPGTLVMVGRVPGHVTRTFTGGFAVAFDRVLEAVEADRLVAGYQVKALPLTNAG